jgi:hypothetical protein
MFTRLGCQGRPPRFSVDFYPYASLSHTFRLRGDEALVRISDLMRGAPLQALEAAAGILLARVYRKHLPAGLAESYRRFAESGGVRRRMNRIRQRRGRRAHTGAQGGAYDLGEIFARVNRDYFGGRLSPLEIGWSVRPWERQLGVFDPGMRQIVINERLDRLEVPEYVVAFVVYHEMLHQGQDAGRSRCRMGLHSPQFRRAEKRFREYERARRFLMRAGIW